MDTQKTEQAATANKFLSLDELFTPNTQYADVTLSNGGKVKIQTASAGTVLSFVEGNKSEKETAGFRLIAESLVHPETKTRLIPTSMPIKDVIEKLAALNNKDVSTLVNACLEHNGMGKTKDEVAAEKNGSSEAR